MLFSITSPALCTKYWFPGFLEVRHTSLEVGAVLEAKNASRDLIHRRRRAMLVLVIVLMPASTSDGMENGVAVECGQGSPASLCTRTYSQRKGAGLAFV
jgi:hypothetical protein